MLVTEAIPKPTFANHESFHLRYGWLKKAYDAAREDGKVFVRDNATIKLGVGKNMVRAIRFWALANKILGYHGKDPRLFPTEMGNVIFDDDHGIDPYLEEPQTLWLLHWLLLAKPCKIPVWWIILNEFTATNIKIDELRDTVHQRITNMPEWQTPSPKSIDKDISVFIHAYTTEQGKLTIEDYLDCPFRQMHMIKQNSRDSMRFVYGAKYGMTPEIIAYASLDFVTRSEIQSKSISVTRLATEAGGVGNIFKIGEDGLGSMLNIACSTSKNIRMDTINGALHLVYDDAKAASDSILAAAYNKTSLNTGQNIEVTL